MGEPITYSLTITNTGTAAGEAEYGGTLSKTTATGQQDLETKTTSLNAGESTTAETEEFSFQESGLANWSFWVEWDGQRDTATFEITVENPEVVFGDSYRTSNGIEITLSNLRFTNEYQYTDFTDEVQSKSAPDGQKWAFVDIRVENVGEEPVTQPNEFSFAIVANETQKEPTLEYRGDDDYGGLSEIVPGVVKSGVIPYLVPTDVSKSDVQIFYNPPLSETQVTWKTE